MIEILIITFIFICFIWAIKLSFSYLLLIFSSLFQFFLASKTNLKSLKKPFVFVLDTSNFGLKTIQNYQVKKKEQDKLKVKKVYSECVSRINTIKNSIQSNIHILPKVFIEEKQIEISKVNQILSSIKDDLYSCQESNINYKKLLEQISVIYPTISEIEFEFLNNLRESNDINT